jgi:hypothetical protein
MFNKRINIFAGHFGSGKTEIAVNCAVKLSSEGKKTSIADLDIVNPYFRTADAKNKLEQNGILVITPLYANTNVDVPALPAEMNTIFEKKEYRIVLDVGGDDLGARVLARYKEQISKEDYDMFFIVNIKRPMTDTLSGIKEMISDIENSSKLKVTKLVNNTNLLGNTSVSDVIQGHKLIKEISDEFGIPISFISGFYENIKGIESKIDTKVFYMDKLIKLPWE